MADPFLKKLEKANKKIWLALFRRIFNNHSVNIPLHPSQTASIKKILIFRTDKIGDMIVTTPLFRLLKQQIPGIFIGVCAGPNNHVLAKNCADVDRVYTLKQTIPSIIAFVREAKREQYDASINCIFNKSTLNGFLANLVLPRGIKFGRQDDRYDFFYNCTTPSSWLDIQMTDVICGFAQEFLGIRYEHGMHHPFVNIPDASRTTAQQTLSRLGMARFVILNISAGQTKNDIETTRYIEFVNQLAQITQLLILLLHTQNDAAKAAEILRQSTYSGLTLYPPTHDLFEVAAVIEQCLFVISPDTAIIHFAAAAKKPVAGFYAMPEITPNHWRPYDVPFEGVRAEEGKGVNSLLPSQMVDTVRRLIQSTGIA